MHEGGTEEFLAHRCALALNLSGKQSDIFFNLSTIYIQVSEPQFIFMKTDKNKLTLLSKKIQMYEK